LTTYPQWDDWQKLALVVSSLDQLVNDAAETTSFLGGLLAAESPKPPSRSKLAATLAGNQANPYLSGFAMLGLEDLGSILPGCEVLGESRSERLTVLTRRLSELPAYRWLSDAHSYRDALQILGSLARVEEGAFAADDAEFTLLSALIGPIQTYLLCVQQPEVLNHPDRKAVQKALAQAIDLQAFFKKHAALHITEGISWSAASSLPEVVSSLQRLAQAGYKSPANDVVRLRTHLTDTLIRALRDSMGGCHSALLKALVALFDYYPEASNLEKRIKQLD
jgi:hypothetical protein